MKNLIFIALLFVTSLTFAQSTLNIHVTSANLILNQTGTYTINNNDNINVICTAPDTYIQSPTYSYWNNGFSAFIQTALEGPEFHTSGFQLWVVMCDGFGIPSYQYTMIFNVIGGLTNVAETSSLSIDSNMTECKFFDISGKYVTNDIQTLKNGLYLIEKDNTFKIINLNKQ